MKAYQAGKAAAAAETHKLRPGHYLGTLRPGSNVELDADQPWYYISKELSAGGYLTVLYLSNGHTAEKSLSKAEATALSSGRPPLYWCTKCAGSGELRKTTNTEGYTYGANGLNRNYFHDKSETTVSRCPQCRGTGWSPQP